MKLTDIKYNSKNPRIIKDDKFFKLVNSILEFPKMMELRPMVYDEENIIQGGNMRSKALLHIKSEGKEKTLKHLESVGKSENISFFESLFLKGEIPDNWTKKACDLTEEEKRRFVIADNIGFGEWDWDALANEWDADQLDDWGLDLPVFDVKKEYFDESENIEIEDAKELDFFDEFIIVKFKNESQYNDFIIKNNIKLVKTSSMNGGKDIRTSFKKVFDYEDLYPVIE